MLSQINCLKKCGLDHWTKVFLLGQIRITDLRRHAWYGTGQIWPLTFTVLQ